MLLFTSENFVFPPTFVKIEVDTNKTIILPVVLYDCGSSSLTLKKEQRFRVFENKVLREIFGAKRDEITDGFRNLQVL